MAQKAFVFGAQTKSLQYTQNDLLLVSEALSQIGYSIFQPEETNKIRILQLFQEFIEDGKQSDKIIFYFSGHGIIKRGRLKLILHNNQEIGISHFVEFLDECGAKTKIVIIDCCFSGSAINDWNKEVLEDERYVLLTATKGLERTKEFDSLKASFMTYFLNRALTKDQNKVTNEKQQITIRKIEEYLEKRHAEFQEQTDETLEKPILFRGIDAVISSLNVPDIVSTFETGSDYSVCIVSSEYPPNVLGGLGVHVDRLSCSLHFHDVKVDLILPKAAEKNYDSSYKENFTVNELSTISATYENPFSWLRFALHAAHKIGEIMPDIIHCHDWVTVLAGVKAKWKYRIPLLYHIHLPNKVAFCSSIENLGLLCADKITVNSQAVKEEIMQNFPNSQIIDRITVIRNGVDTDSFIPSVPWPRESDYILFVGRLEHQKGINILIKAFYYVLKKFPQIRLKIVGTGTMEERLKQLCANLILHNQVDFEGFKTGHKLVNMYQYAKIVIVPSVHEPFGMTAIEGMACKRPVIVSNVVGGLRENVRHSQNGFVFESQDYLDLAQWIMKLLNDEDLRQKLGAAGYNFIQWKNFDWKFVAQEYKSLYAEMKRSKTNFEVPERVQEYWEQINRLAREHERDIGRNPEIYLNQLFDWIQ